MDELIIRVPRKPKPRKGRLTTRISADAYAVADDIAARSGKSLCTVVSEMVLFAAAHTKVVYDDEK